MKPGRRTVNLVKSSSGPGMTTVADGYHEAEILDYLGESRNEEVPQSSTTMKTTSGDHEAVLAIQALLRRQVPAPGVPYLCNPTTRPGWVEPTVLGQNPEGEGLRSFLQYLVCNLCYGHGHSSPDCILTIRQFMKVVENYGILTTMEKAAVSSTF